MSNPAVVFDPYAADHRGIVQEIVDNYCIASTGKAEWYPVAFFLRDENGEVLGGLLGDIWAAWLHVRTLAVAAPVRGRGFGKELMKRAESYAIERAALMHISTPSVFRHDHFTKSLGTAYSGRLKIIRSGTSIIS
jgi:GNAT superfamily N-acetyltransferase